MMLPRGTDIGSSGQLTSASAQDVPTSLAQTAARAESFHATAEELNLTPSAVDGFQPLAVISTRSLGR